LDDTVTVQVSKDKALLLVEGTIGNMNILLNDNSSNYDGINSEDKLNSLKIQVAD
jgi:hypothetical protein